LSNSRRRAQGNTVSQLTLFPETLYVFVDETGQEHLAGSSFYGLGSCAVLGRDYERFIAGPWSLVRLAVAGHELASLHAADFGRSATPQQLEDVVRYFREKPFMRLGAAGAVTTLLADDIPLMQIVLGSLKLRIIDVAKWTPFTAINVIFEANQRANKLVQRYFGDFRVTADDKEVPVDCYFMPKSTREPVLEVADFIANAIGDHARHTLVDKRSGFRKDFHAIFHGVDHRLVSFIGIEKVEEPQPPLESEK
jgi:hypothetical protein